MKKIIVLFLLTLAIPFVLYAQKVDINSAKKVAVNFFHEKLLNTAQKKSLNDIKVTNSLSVKKNNRTLYFVFDINNSGYVMVSASRSTMPVIGYSDENIYMQENQPPAFIKWMGEFEKQINISFDNSNVASVEVDKVWNKYLNYDGNTLSSKSTITPVAPLLTTKWNQDKYYNGRCPEDNAGPGQRAYAGCVPTAMGQVMNYYRWPNTGTGSYSYLDSTYGTQTANFAATNYHWDEMPVQLTTFDSSLAILLYHLGVSVDLKYGPNGSGMYNHKAAYSLKTYFKYSPETQYMYRDTTVHLNWKQIVLKHLDRKMPMYYAGWSDTIYVSGHAFVCDGYSDTTFFHFNWGWGGSYDNYFNLDGLNPGGSDFNLRQELIVNMFPDTVNYTYPYYCSGTKLLDMPSGTIDDGSGPVYNYANNLDCMWLIAPSDSVSKINIEFLKFDTQSGHDSLYIYNGPSLSSPLLGVYTGSTIPSNISSTKSKVLIRFKTDSDTVKSGWLIGYKSTIPVFCSGVSNLTAQTTTFSDGSGNKNYNRNSFCRWNIAPTGAASINLHFNSFDLAPDDYIRIKDIVNNFTIVEFTGDSIPHDVVCNSANAQVWFRSNDNEITGNGFEILYTTTSFIPEFNMDLGEISVYPNPTAENLNISFSTEESQDIRICVFNSLGKIVRSENFSNVFGKFSRKIDMSGFPEGVYMVTVRSNENLFSTKVIKAGF